MKEKYLYRVTSPDRRSCYAVAEDQRRAARIANRMFEQVFDNEQMTVEYVDRVIIVGEMEPDEK